MSTGDIIEHLTSEVMRSISRDGVPFRPGARELLADLKDAGLKTALVTMSMRRMASHIAELIDFDAFDLVVAGTDAGHAELSLFMRMISSIGHSIGCDNGSAVSNRYDGPYPFTGDLREIVIQSSPGRFYDAAEAEARAEMSRQ